MQKLERCTELGESSKAYSLTLELQDAPHVSLMNAERTTVAMDVTEQLLVQSTEQQHSLSQNLHTSKTSTPSHSPDSTDGEIVARRRMLKKSLTPAIIITSDSSDEKVSKIDRGRGKKKKVRKSAPLTPATVPSDTSDDEPSTKVCKRTRRKKSTLVTSGSSANEPPVVVEEMPKSQIVSIISNDDESTQILNRSARSRSLSATPEQAQETRTCSERSLSPLSDLHCDEIRIVLSEVETPPSSRVSSRSSSSASSSTNSGRASTSKRTATIETPPPASPPKLVHSKCSMCKVDIKPGECPFGDHSLYCSKGCVKRQVACVESFGIDPKAHIKVVNEKTGEAAHKILTRK